jgi:endonuclease/exonuclease/phosphatase family metal-dependent hydrolase
MGDNNNLIYNNTISQLNEFFVDEVPYVGGVTQNVENETSGMALFTRIPIKSLEQIKDVVLDNMVDFKLTHDLLKVNFDLGFEELLLINSHLKCCTGTENKQIRVNEQEGIINLMDEIGTKPLIYLGDLNSLSRYDIENFLVEDTLGSEPINMLLNQSHTKASQIHEFKDVFRTMNQTHLGITYRDIPSRIDYIFTNQFLFDNIVGSTIGDTPSAQNGSDHFSVDLSLEFKDIISWNSNVNPNSQGISTNFIGFLSILGNFSLLSFLKKKYV